MQLEKVIKGLKKGSNSALKELYDTYGNLFFSITLRYSSSTQEAEDYVQETFVHIFNNIDQYQGNGSFEGWMKRILVNHCLSGIRKQNVLKHAEALEVDGTNPGEAVEASIIEALSVEELMETIQQLPPGLRAVLNLYVFEGYKHQEIGKELGITESASRSQLSKARVRLQEFIQKKENAFTIHV